MNTNVPLELHQRILDLIKEQKALTEWDIEQKTGSARGNVMTALATLTNENKNLYEDDAGYLRLMR